MAENSAEFNFARKVLIAVGLICLTLLLLLLVYFAFDVLLLVFGASLLAIFLRGLADVLCRFVNVSESLAVGIVTVVIIGVLAGAIALLAPDVAEQVAHLREELPRSAQAASAWLSQFGWGRTIIAQLPSLETVRDNINPYGILAGVGGFFSSTLGAVGNFFVVLLLAIYLASRAAILYARLYELVSAR